RASVLKPRRAGRKPSLHSSHVHSHSGWHCRIPGIIVQKKATHIGCFCKGIYPYSDIGLRCEPEIRLHPLVSFGKLLRDILIGNATGDDNVIAMPPVSGCGNAVVCRKLQAIDHAEDLIEVPACRCRVRDRQLDFLIRTDYKYGPYRELIICVGMDHTVKVGNLKLGVRDQRKVDGSLLSFINIAYPLLVWIEGIDAKRQHLYISFIEF